MIDTEVITISRAEYEAMKARLEDLDDIVAAQAAATGVALPQEFAVRIMDGEHPVRVWRDYRGLSAAALAAAAGMSPPYLSEIETGKKPGSIEAFRGLAGALAVPVDALLP